MSVAMTRVLATRRVLAIAVVLRALLWAAGAFLAALAALAVVDALLGLPLAMREIVRALLPPGAAGVAAIVLWRGRAVVSPEHVALWVENHVPSLHYAFVTAVDPRHAGSLSLLDPLVASAGWGSVLAARALRSLAVPAGTAAGALALLLVLPAGAVSRVRDPAVGDALDRVRGTSTDAPAGLSPIIATITPPPYTGERARTLEEPTVIAAPVGSRVVLRGRVSARASAGGRADAPAAAQVSRNIVASLGGAALAVGIADGRWTVALDMPAAATAIRLARGSVARLIALEPRADSAPTVVLSSPQRDSVYATPAGTIVLVAEARDDYGVADVAFEYMVTSGEGERFTFRQGTLGARAGRDERRVEWRTAVALDSLGLGAGDVVHLRAIARDANALSGGSTGVSETRAIRIARAGEHDSVAIEGAPPPEPDRAALSQRMLIVLTEALEARRPALDRTTVVAESRSLARDQARLRRLVGEIIFTRLGDDTGGEHAHGPGDGHDHTDEELSRLFSPDSLLAAADRATGARAQGEALDFAHGESPVLAINRPLLEAYNHMWDAGRELEQGEPGLALPPMRRALDALQEARAAERYFLRGRPPTIVVDIERVRLAAREVVTPGGRDPRAPAAETVERHADRYQRAVELLSRDPSAAIDSLLLLRIDALDGSPAVARALDDAIEALRAGRDATAPLLSARRAIEGPPMGAVPLGKWGGW